VVWGSAWPYSADAGGATLGSNYGWTTTTFSRVGGGLFDLQSIDLADFFDNALGQQGGDVRLTFNDADGSTSQTVTIDDLPGLQTFTFNRSNLLSASYEPVTTFGPLIQVDNILVDTNDARTSLAVPESAVPEPATWAMMLLGFGLVGGALRSAKRKPKPTLSYA
jgi:PEP-CTERM motif-containing protein